MLHIETGYQGAQQKALLSIVYTSRYPEVCDAALRLAPEAFIVAADVKMSTVWDTPFSRRARRRPEKALGTACGAKWIRGSFFCAAGRWPRLDRGTSTG